ncbi:hypothetical protein EMA8858_04208 [Emticicia aquatica]|uniref:Uncharacterized protein n=1 Tax=Emticicia aquatica TaxID=1681835 RepID=A0ABM9AW65_9BACT|nr:hypothetical protein EMA8858_04208 [Emticicia aquatica]
MENKKMTYFVDKWKVFKANQSNGMVSIPISFMDDLIYEIVKKTLNEEISRLNNSSSK